MGNIVGVFLVGAVINGIVFGAFCGWLAQEKGRDSGNWIVLGFFFGILALLALAASPTLENGNPNAVHSTNKPTTSSSKEEIVLPEQKSCPRCAEAIKFNAIICHYCGHEFGEESIKRASEEYIRAQEARIAEQNRVAAAQQELIEAETEKKNLEHDLLIHTRILYFMDLTAELPNRGQDINYLEKLIDAGADLNIRGDFLKCTPLHLAIRYQAQPVVALLIRKGAEVNATDLFGRTPLDYAIKRNRADIVELLRESGALTGSEIRPQQKVVVKRAKTHFEIICGHCDKILSVPKNYAGTSGKCNHCGTALTVPKK